jgi:GNAT superfamily N-acetyltransferase
MAEVLAIIQPLTGQWFTKEVAKNVVFDLHFQDLAALFANRTLLSFITFTCLNGSIFITLMATKKEHHGKGYGTKLYRWFENCVRRNGFNSIKVQTVPGDVNPNYHGTRAFYEKQGFVFVKRYNELWEHGAIELVKNLK